MKNIVGIMQQILNKSYIFECKYTRNEINIIELKELKQEKNAKHAARNIIMTS
jgi:hypothetical protein